MSSRNYIAFQLSCLNFSGPEDNVAEYYQQQVEMLEGFTEMDALADRGFVPRLSAVGFDLFDLLLDACLTF